MENILKPFLALLPARKATVKSSTKKADGPPPAIHHLLYAMRDLNPSFVAIAADVRVFPWPHGVTERPDVDAHIDEDALTDPGLAESSVLTASTHAGAPADGAKPKKGRVRAAWGCCLTQRGTVTFVNPDGLTKMNATVSRRDMERIEVRGQRHCIDAVVDGVRLSVVWTHVECDAQSASNAKRRFREVAASVLPDVEYIDVTPEPEEHDEQEDEVQDEHDVAKEAQEEEAAEVVDEKDEVPADDENAIASAPEGEDNEQDDAVASSASTEYEEVEEESDEEAVPLDPVVALLVKAKTTASDIGRRRSQALRYLAENPLAESGIELVSETASQTSSSVPQTMSARERALRLSLLVLLACDKRRTAAVAAAHRPVTGPWQR